MKISVLVPYGVDDTPNGKQRRRVWEYVLRQWGPMHAALDLEILQGTDRLHNHAHGPFIGYPHCYVNSSTMDTPTSHIHEFSVSRALNDAALRATGEVFLLFGADHIPTYSAVSWAVDSLRHHPWQRIYDKVAYASQAGTQLVLNGYKIDESEWTHHAFPCPGVLAIRASAWNFVGGMDERYEGYGYEDSALFARLSKEFGPTYGASGEVLRELWTGDSPRPLHGTRNEALYRADWGHAHGL